MRENVPIESPQLYSALFHPFLEGFPVQPVTVAEPVNKEAHRELRQHILAADSTHVIAAAHAPCDYLIQRDREAGPEMSFRRSPSTMIFN